MLRMLLILSQFSKFPLPACQVEYGKHHALDELTRGPSFVPRLVSLHVTP